MNPLSDRLRAHAKEALEIADAIDALYSERNEYHRQAKWWAARVQHEPSYWENIVLGSETARTE